MKKMLVSIFLLFIIANSLLANTDNNNSSSQKKQTLNSIHTLSINLVLPDFHSVVTKFENDDREDVHLADGYNIYNIGIGLDYIYQMKYLGFGVGTQLFFSKWQTPEGFHDNYNNNLEYYYIPVFGILETHYIFKYVTVYLSGQFGALYNSLRVSSFGTANYVSLCWGLRFGIRFLDNLFVELSVLSEIKRKPDENYNGLIERKSSSENVVIETFGLNTSTINLGYIFKF